MPYVNRLLLICSICLSQGFSNGGGIVDDANLQPQIMDSNKYHSINPRDKKINISVGIGDNRTGMSLIGLSYKFFQRDNNEAFLGLGTAFFIYNTSLGWKHYFSDNEKSPYVVLSLQAISKWLDADDYWNNTGITIAPTLSVGFENENSKTISTQLGISAMSMYSGASNKMSLGGYWVLSFIFHFFK